MSDSNRRLPQPSSVKLRPGLRCIAFLDPVEAWRALPARAQEEIGAAAIAMVVAMGGAATLHGAGDPAAAQPYDTAMVEAARWLDALVLVTVLRATFGLPPVPDLRPLGVQQCTGCGCTENRACSGGCSWVTEDLCSACAVHA